jgi:hypothetical protein
LIVTAPAFGRPLSPATAGATGNSPGARRPTQAVCGRDLHAALQLGTPAVADLHGSQVFGSGTDEARFWDEPTLRLHWSVPERVWMIADLRRRKAQPR